MMRQNTLLHVLSIDLLGARRWNTTLESILGGLSPTVS